VEVASAWLTGFLGVVMADPRFINNTVVVVTFDEDDDTVKNHIFTMLLGPLVPKQSLNGSPYNHFSLLRMIEDNFEVGNLGRNDATAVPISLNGTFFLTLPSAGGRLTPLIIYLVVTVLLLTL
jgi:hypothetical protein